MFLSEGILGCIGNTPLLRCPTLRPPGGAEIYFKLEGYNASGSVKARAAKSMIESAIRRGDVTDEQAFVEPSSGNLGLAIALISAAKERQCTLIVDPRMTQYSERIMRSYGAEVMCVTQPDSGGSWQGSRLAQAKKIVAEQQAHMFFQYSNPDNATAHYETTAREIIEQLGTIPDVCVVGVSTGGQLSGIGRRLKLTGSCRMVAVDVEGSSIFGGTYVPYHLRGLDLSWWPANLNADYIDGVYRLKEEFAFLVEAVSSAGEHIILGITEKITTGPPHFVEVSHLTPASLSKEEREDITSTVARCLDILDVCVGATHTEVKYRPPHTFIIETHTRPGGDRIPRITELVHGYEQYELSARSILGLPLPEAKPYQFSAAAVHYFQWSPGEVAQILGVEATRHRLDIVELRLDIAQGSVLVPWTNSDDRPGFVVLGGSTLDEVRTRMRAIQDTISISYKEEDAPL